MISTLKEIKLRPIGVIHSPYQKREEAPRQGRLVDATSVIEIFSEFLDGLKSVESSTHLIVLYWQDRSNRTVLKSFTLFSDEPMGVFATRSPNRPNPIAFCIAEIVEIEGNMLTVRGVDALDGSPLLDLKMYSPRIDSIPEARTDHIPHKWLDSSHE